MTKTAVLILAGATLLSGCAAQKQWAYRAETPSGFPEATLCFSPDRAAEAGTAIGTALRAEGYATVPHQAHEGLLGVFSRDVSNVLDLTSLQTRTSILHIFISSADERHWTLTTELAESRVGVPVTRIDRVGGAYLVSDWGGAAVTAPQDGYAAYHVERALNAAEARFPCGNSS